MYVYQRKRFVTQHAVSAFYVFHRTYVYDRSASIIMNLITAGSTDCVIALHYLAFHLARSELQDKANLNFRPTLHKRVTWRSFTCTIKRRSWNLWTYRHGVSHTTVHVVVTVMIMCNIFVVVGMIFMVMGDIFVIVGVIFMVHCCYFWCSCLQWKHFTHIRSCFAFLFKELTWYDNPKKLAVSTTNNRRMFVMLFRKLHLELIALKIL